MNRLLTEQAIHCPFCAEAITILIDTSAGNQEYIEDCQVCCRPMQIRLTTSDGELDSVDVGCAS